MSYQVLARKYRPSDFSTLIGQEHVVRALTHALQQQRLHHAYLFTGTRGVGKTTLSRILAKALNCETGISAEPCGKCDACNAIDAGRFVDYIEMDAASNRGVDEMAQLLEQAVYAPSNARFKVYMIDEVHMLTNHAFNAMLKTLEEPPAHVKFILATTDPQKIPVTVLSRCLQFNLKQMPPPHIVAHLQNILAQEQIGFEIPALQLLARGAQGSMRDALSLTDQAIAYSAGDLTLAAVQGMLGALDESYLVRLLDMLAAADANGLLVICDQMAARSLSYGVALQDLGSMLHQIALAQLAPAALPTDAPAYDDIVRLAQQFDAEEIQLFYQIALHGRNELGLAPDEYAGFSMTLLRMLAFRPQRAGAVDSPAAIAIKPSAPVPSNVVSAPTPTAVSMPLRDTSAGPARAALDAARKSVKTDKRAVAEMLPKNPIQSKPISRPSQVKHAQVETPSLRLQPDQFDATEQSVAQTASVYQSSAAYLIDAPLPTTQPATAKTADNNFDWSGDWPALAAQLPLRGVVQQLAQQSECVGVEQLPHALQWQLRVPLDTLLSAGSADKLAAALTQHFGRQVQVSTEIGAVRHTAHAQGVEQRQSRQRDAEQTMRDDPFVQTLIREFGATIVPGSIRPI